MQMENVVPQSWFASYLGPNADEASKGHKRQAPLQQQRAAFSDITNNANGRLGAAGVKVLFAGLVNPGTS